MTEIIVKCEKGPGELFSLRCSCVAEAEIETYLRVTMVGYSPDSGDHHSAVLTACELTTCTDKG